MNASFSPATPDDRELLVELMRKLREDDPDQGGFDESAARKAMSVLLSDSSAGKIWIIRRDEEVAGYVALTFAFSIEFGGRVGIVDELFVTRSHRRQGIGRAAMEFVQQQAEELGARVLVLEVARANESAKSLYQSAGFENRLYQTMIKKI